MLKEVKQLADALGERRDPDVAIEALESVASELGAAERPGVEGLVEELRAEQEAGNETVARALEEARAAGLRGAAGGARPHGSPGGGAGVKARKVKGLDPDGPLADNARRIVAVRLAELRSLRARARSTRTRSRRCTTCGSPPSGCATCWSSPRPAFGRPAAGRRAHGQDACRTCSARSTTAT